MSEHRVSPHPPVRAGAAPAAPVPAWSWFFVVPCAAFALAGIDLGARDPVGDPVAEGIKQMIAVVVCAGAAFGAPLAARTRRPLLQRVSACAALAFASAIAFAWAAPRRTAVDWRRFDGGAWSAEFPGPPELSSRNAPGPAGEAPLREAVAAARGALFRVQESEPPASAGDDPAVLLARARAGALRSGRERIVEERPLRAARGGAAAGLELRFHLDGHDFRARIWAAPPRVLVLTAGPLDEARPEADRFLESLQLARPR